MGKKTRVSKAPEERKQEILKVAAELFIEKGYYEVSVEQIAEKIGIVKGTCYRYFSSKKELFFAALDVVGDKFVNEVVGTLEESSISVKKRLNKVLSECEVQFSQMKQLVNEYSEEKKYNQQSLDMLRIITYYKLAESMKVFLEDGCKEGVFKIDNITGRAYSIIFSIFGITTAPISEEAIMSELRFCFEKMLDINLDDWKG